jgi:hypothetical protein
MRNALVRAVTSTQRARRRRFADYPPAFFAKPTGYRARWHRATIRRRPTSPYARQTDALEGAGRYIGRAADQTRQFTSRRPTRPQLKMAQASQIGSGLVIHGD